MITINELYRGCVALINDEKNDCIKEVIELGIEKTINDIQNNEIQDFEKYKNYFYNIYLKEEKVGPNERLLMRKEIAKRIINFFDSRKPVLFEITKYVSLKSVEKNDVKVRTFRMYKIADEISLNIISLCVFRNYENLIPKNSYANKLAEDNGKTFYKNYLPSYNAFISNKYNLLKTHGYNRLLITDIVKYYDRINEETLIKIMKNFLPFDKNHEDYMFYEKYFEFINNNCNQGLPQGPVFAHFLGALLLYDLPKAFKDKFPDYHVDIYVDDLQIFYYSNNSEAGSDEILKFIDNYLESRLKISKDLDDVITNGYNFLSREKTSIINLKENNSKYIILSQELSAINLLKADYNNLEENDKESLKKALDDNLREFFELIDSKASKVALYSVYKKQRRFTNYRKLLMTNNEKELISTIEEIKKTDGAGLFDRSFSNYIIAIKAQLLSYGKNTEEFKNILYKKVLNKLDEYKNNPWYKDIENYYKTVCNYYILEYDNHFNYRNKTQNSEQCPEYTVHAIYDSMVDFKSQYDKIIKIEGNNNYISYSVELLSDEDKLKIKLVKSDNIYHRNNNLIIIIRNIFDRLFYVSHFSSYKIALPFSYKNRIYKLVEYRIIEYLLTSQDDFSDKIDYIIKILEDHKSDREFELVDPEILEVVKTAIRSKCKGKYLDQIIVAHHFIRDIWKNGAQDMPFYTLHNQEHSIELIKILSKIDEKLNGKLFSRMNMIEKYSLIMAIYLHDLGMLYFSSVDLLEGANCTLSRKMELAIQEKFKMIQANGSEYTRGKILRKALDFHKSISFYRTEKTRSAHSYNSRRFSDEFNFVIPELKYVVLEIANNHYLDIDKIYEQDIWYHMNKIDVRYLSVLLRVADSLDQSINRVSNTLYTYFDKYVEEMDSTSLAHWAKHMLVKNIMIEKETVKKPKYREEYNVIIQFNTLPFAKSFGKSNKVVKHDRENNNLVYNDKGRKTKSLLDVFLDYFFKYVFMEMNNLNEYLTSELDIYIHIKYEDLKNEEKRFKKYEQRLSDFLIEI